MKPTSLLSQFVAAVLVLGAGSAFTPVRAQDNSVNSEWIAPARAAKKVNPVPADDASIAQGKQLYTLACVPCHGSAGKGDGPTAGTLERNGVRVRPGDLSDPKRWLDTDGALFWKLTEGKTPMPAWGATLSEEQRWTIINYVRTLAPKPQGSLASAQTASKN